MNKRLIIAAGVFLSAVIIISGVCFYNYRYQQGKEQNALSSNHIAPADSTGNSGNGSKVEGAMRGFAAPDFELRDIEGRTVKLGDYTQKIVFINFWTSWCSACKEELLMWAEEGEKMASDPHVAIISVNVGESEEKVREFMDNNGIDLNVLLDTRQNVAEKYGISAFPTTFILEKGGVVYDIYTTRLSSDEVAEYIYTIKNKD